METNYLSMRIQCSVRAADVLRKQARDMNLEACGSMPIKGTGGMPTYFINGYGSSSVKPGVIDKVVEEESAVENSTKNQIGWMNNNNNNNNKHWRGNGPGQLSAGRVCLFLGVIFWIATSCTHGGLEVAC